MTSRRGTSPMPPALAGSGSTESPPAPAAARGWRTLTLEEIRVGEELPELRVDVTASLIVAGALASRDYQDVHHDHAAAVRNGAKDIFMNILTTNGLVGRYVTDWAGAEAIIKEVRVRLGAPNYPGDVMVMTGRVISADDSGTERTVIVEVRGTNGRGDHVTGTVTLSLPMAAP
jgi:acyl dehydratase